jgi:hypothetical protein
MDGHFRDSVHAFVLEFQLRVKTFFTFRWFDPNIRAVGSSGIGGWWKVYSCLISPSGSSGIEQHNSELIHFTSKSCS